MDRGYCVRKDSELFLKKTLEFKRETEENAFKLNINYFFDIPNIEIEIEDILEELIREHYISQKSEFFEDSIAIYLTLDGITYFDEETEVNRNQNTIFNVTGGQINVAYDNGKIEAKQHSNSEKNNEENIKVIIIHDTKIEKHTSVDSSAASSNSENEQLILAGIILVILTITYLKYRLQVQLGLVITSIIIEIITCLIYYNGKKMGIIYGKNIKEISYFNMISIFVVPILIGIINSPIYTSKVNFVSLIQVIESQSIVVALLNHESGVYAIFQMAGMLFLAMFMVYIISSDIYIISIINIVSGKKGQWLWNNLLKLTCMGNKNWKDHVKVGTFFLIISILFVGGILPYIINWLNAGNLSIIKERLN